MEKEPDRGEDPGILPGPGEGRGNQTPRVNNEKPQHQNEKLGIALGLISGGVTLVIASRIVGIGDSSEPAAVFSGSLLGSGVGLVSAGVGYLMYLVKR